jgi:hypothetical protein
MNLLARPPVGHPDRYQQATFRNQFGIAGGRFAVAQRFHPETRDNGVAKVTKITVAVVTASTAATLGLGAAIATAAPPPKPANQKTDFPQDKAQPAKPPTRVNQPQPPAEKPESSIGDEQTTTGGS